ncbi:erythromycin esterase family protein [Actinomadura madurae]|uniref:erythromycin esterase family protein n=1 Tax=Actinomadura madurae TaxID=1993 RepID=UPI00399A6800
MKQRTALRFVASAAGTVVLFSGVGLTAQASAETAARPAAASTVLETRAVTAWIERNAHRLGTVDPVAPLDDLEPLRRSVGNASIVGLGEPQHGLREVTALKHRTLRYLVERMGFRSIAWEDDWTLGLEIDRYVRTGEGDIDALLRRTSGAWANRDTADALNWLRDFNKGRKKSDQVRFVGVEYYTTWLPAYDIVDAHVAKAAPSLVPELRRHMEWLRPTKPDAWAHAGWYMNEVKDKKPYVEHARDLYDMVERLPHRPGDRAYSLAVHAAKQIRSFYLNYYIPRETSYAFRDARAAENLRWWRGRHHGKVVYWAATPHTAVAPGMRLFSPEQGEMAFASVGSYLRRWFGDGYRSIGFTFDHGTIAGESGTVEMPPPREGWVERPFGQATRFDQLLMDLRVDAPAPVREWLRSPIATRGIATETPELPYDSYATGGTVRQWFDLVVHRQAVTPARPL